MASILNEDFINQDDWAVELAIGCKMFATDPNTAYQIVKRLLDAHCKKHDLRLCWKKHDYIAIAPLTKCSYDNTVVEPRLIVATEHRARWHCCVYRHLGNRGPRNRRDQWFTCVRSQDNPILSSSYQFSNFDKYIIPADALDILLQMLPKSEGFDDRKMPL